MENKQFISVDWGTSNLRVRLIEADGLCIQKELSFAEGVKTMYQQWQTTGEDREVFFLGFLKEKIDQLVVIEDTTPVVISGMASASIGLRELPYARLPFDSNGSTLHVEDIHSTVLSNPIVLISGVRSDDDVIRGEEVQLVGLMDDNGSGENSVFILPGTHSKHLICEKGRVIDFKTFMTGEMFQIIAQHSILQASVKTATRGSEELSAFEEGVLKAKEDSSILNELFKIRAFDLFGTRSKAENFHYLSGLLIGEEMSTLLNIKLDKIKLCAGGGLFDLYKRAAEVLGLARNTEIVDKETVDSSVICGQWKILNSRK
ncbi:MAG: 2-dehydro-3-deoxygalactonokinase [Cyclobacteriaceae bacterium]